MLSNKGIHFKVSERKILLRILDVLAVFGGLYVISYSFEFDYFTITKENWTWSIVLMVYLSIFGSVFELYDLQKSSQFDTVFRNVILTVSITVLFYLLTPIITPFLPVKRIQIIYFYLAIISSMFLWRVIYITFFASSRFYKKVIILGEISNIENVVKTISESDPNYKIIGFVNSEKLEIDTIKFKGLIEYLPEDLPRIIKTKKVSELVVAITNPNNITAEIYNQLTSLLEQGLTIREYTQVFEEITKRVPIQFVEKDFYKYFPFSRSNQNKLYLFFHRVMDIVFSTIGIIFGIILTPFIIIGNLLANRGTLFYTQERIGKYGKPFKIIKFRTMIKNAENLGVVWADKKDKRVTTFGRFLRNTRIDEIPQFFNVLKGEMSIIGPRPERPFFVKVLSVIIPFYETRHTIKPGLSGWAQVNSRYGSTVEDSLNKLQYDLYYIKHRNFFLDINIIVKTLSTIIYYRGQ
ncbi:exopolysaccharide biosynthesis polyprenyl glycosylphosphotransferase [bacterium AH-315-P13]|nr:exopolysaccharide biosynthesis polyprenyl glycosylphosphotransferase [bacterium AH-315-P13]